MFKIRRVGQLPLTVLAALAMTPTVFGVGPWIEAHIFPVVGRAQISHAEKTRTGTSFYVSFKKRRQCEFLALVWYQGPVRLTVDFEPHAEESPRSRPPGEQYAGPWLVRGLTQIEGSRALAYHRCHPLWTTITTF